MRHSGLWLRFLLSSGEALLHVTQGGQAPSGGSTAKELVLGIEATNASAQLIVSGRPGSRYEISTTADFQSWTNLTLKQSDTNGVARFDLGLVSPKLFFRAAEIESTSLLRAEVQLGKRLFLETR